MPNRKTGFETTLVRRYAHPISRVYEVWTRPEHLERWLSPADDIHMQVVEFDFSEGGAYHFRYSWSEGVFPVRGRFLTIQPEKNLIFSWVPQPPDPDAGKDTIVSVWFRACPNGETEIEVRHTLFPDERMRARHQEGWTGTLDRLGRLLASPDIISQPNESIQQNANL